MDFCSFSLSHSMEETQLNRSQRVFLIYPIRVILLFIHCWHFCTGSLHIQNKELLFPYPSIIIFGSPFFYIKNPLSLYWKLVPAHLQVGWINKGIRWESEAVPATVSCSRSSGVCPFMPLSPKFWDGKAAKNASQETCLFQKIYWIQSFRVKSWDGPHRFPILFGTSWTLSFNHTCALD